MARILVVDDSEVDRRLIVGLLRRDRNHRIQQAEDGRQAWRWISSSPPDLVITDLVMPGMDGLELVRKLRSQYPAIPVILLTAYGNEAIAIDAIDAGAASYVPKAQQAARLVETVGRVLRHATANHVLDRLALSTLEHQWRVALDNDERLIHALVSRVEEMMTNVGFADQGQRIRIGEALEEALLNAMYHGNLELNERELADARIDLSGADLARLVDLRRGQAEYRGRKILVATKISEAEVRFNIRDQGRGFNVRALVGVDPIEAFNQGKHRGLTLIQSMMEKVSFNEAGNELTMSHCNSNRHESSTTAQSRDSGLL